MGADDSRTTYTKFNPARPRMIRLTSLLVQPPASGVPAKFQKFKFVPAMLVVGRTSRCKTRIYLMCYMTGKSSMDITYQ